MTNAPDHDAWYRKAFGPRYRAVYKHRDDASARAECAFAFRAVGATSGVRWLDVGCGDGRHASALEELGARVVGIDLSRELLEVARARGLRRLARADMRRPPIADGAFDVASFFFTSFGYFDDADNRAVLSEVRKALRFGGRLLLDLPNVARLRGSLKPFDVVEREEGRTTSRRALVGKRVEKEVTFEPSDGGEPLRYVESVRLYDPVELDEELRSAGFFVLKRFGSFEGVEVSEGDRDVVIAEARR